MVDCFTRWTEAFPLPDKTAQSVADAFFNQIVCRFGMPSVIHSDQGWEFENKIMQELCLLGGSHKTRTTPYHPESDGMVELFNRTLLMMLAMFAGKNRDDWDDLLTAVMMAYRSSVHESTGFSPYRLMFGKECTLPMDIGLPTEQLETTEEITSPYAIWVRDALEEAYEQVRLHSGQAVQRQKRLYDRRAVKRNFTVGDCKEVQTGFSLDWPIFGSFIHGMDNRNTKEPRFSDSDGALSGRQEDTGPSGSDVLVDIKGIANKAIGYSTGG